MSRKIRYALMDPSGNVTILVATPVPEEEQPAIGAQLMAKESKAEQVGFLSWPGGCDIAIRMAGGEFCGNAVMSAAVYHALRTGLAGGVMSVKVSGASGPVKAEIEAGEDGRWHGSVEMPEPCAVETVCFPEGEILPVVAFPGISHVILEKPIPKEEAEKLAVRWCGFLGADALGLMFFNREENRLSPLVYVPEAKTLFWESACGSGATALAVWMAQERGAKTTVSPYQPGGILRVTAERDGKPRLSGTVAFLYEEAAEI